MTDCIIENGRIIDGTGRAAFAGSVLVRGGTIAAVGDAADREAAAVLVAINSVIQVLIFAVLGWFYLSVLPGWLGMNQTAIATSTWQIAKSVLIFLGIPLVAGYLTRRYGEKARGRTWYESTFLPRIGPWALYGLLFTIVILFTCQ